MPDLSYLSDDEYEAELDRQHEAYVERRLESPEFYEVRTF